VHQHTINVLELCRSTRNRIKKVEEHEEDDTEQEDNENDSKGVRLHSLEQQEIEQKGEDSKK